MTKLPRNITLKLTPAEAKVLSDHLRTDLSFGADGTFSDETLDDEVEVNIAKGICNMLASKRGLLYPFPDLKTRTPGLKQ